MTITEAFPTGFASLSDGITTIPFIFTDGQGKKNPLSFRTDPYPRQALKTTTGESKYSDLEPPFFAIPQDDFTGGRGNEDFENDTSRYLDGRRIDTSKEGGVVLGGRETYSTGYHNVDQVMPGNVAFRGLYSTVRYSATSFVASASYTSYQCEVWLKRIGTPGSIQVQLWSDSEPTGTPNTMLATKTLTPAAISSDTVFGGVSELVSFVWTGSPGLTDGTTYWVVLHSLIVDSAANHWEFASNLVAGKESTNGTDWTTSSRTTYFRITPARADFIGKFFEYKRGMYMVTQPDDNGNSILYLNGDRGAADSNSGNGPDHPTPSEAAKTYLVDATKTWTADEWIGDIVLITNGPGSEELQNWRTITDSTVTALLVSPAWNVTHTTATEYVILGSDKWTLQQDTGDQITDVAVAGEHIYFAQGDGIHLTSKIARYKYYNDGGTWTETYTNETEAVANLLLPITHTNSGDTLYLSRNSDSIYGVSIGKAQVPSFWNKLYHDDGTFVQTGIAWADYDFTSGGQNTAEEGATKIGIGAGFSTGTAAVKNISPINITASNDIHMLIHSSKATNLGDLQFKYDDVEDLGKTWSPVKVLKADRTYSRPPTKVFHNVAFSGANTYTDESTWYDGKGAGIEPTVATFTWDNADFVLIGYSIPFDTVAWDIGSTVNAVTATIAASYFNGTTFTAVSNWNDATLDSGATLGQDGNMTWTMPENWVKNTINDVEAYWLLLNATATLTTDVIISQVTIIINDAVTIESLYNDLTNVYDGDAATGEWLTLGTEDFLYVGNGTKFNKITVDVGSPSNDIASVMTAAYWTGSIWSAVTITDTTKVNGDTLKQDGTITFTIPNDWEANSVNGTETYWIRLDVSVALVTAFSINEITVTRQNNVTISIPALAANTWTGINLSFVPEAYPLPDDTAIASVGINVAVDNAAQVVKIRDVKLVSELWSTDQIFKLPENFRITGMEAYSGNVDDPVENPWIFTEKGVYELQTQNDQVVAIPLKELATLQSSENGLGHTVNSTYLYFNIGEKIERYFNRTLDDIGPDRDEGLPDDRPGIPKSLASYPGRVYAGIDAGASGTSSVLALDGSAWHEVYRAPRSGERIRSISIQAIPGTNVDRLWISMGSDILSVPISLNPYNETDFKYTHMSILETSWIYAGMLDVQKTWKSLKVFQENTTGYSSFIYTDYKVDTDTSWTYITGYNEEPVEEQDIASTLPQSKRIKYRFRFVTDDETKSARLKAIVTEGVSFVPVKTKYSWTFVISKDSQNIDLKGKWNSDLTSLQKRDQLLTWANAGTPLTMRHYSAVYDNKTVWVDPASVAPLRIVANQDIENHVTQLSCFDY